MSKEEKYKGIIKKFIEIIKKEIKISCKEIESSENLNQIKYNEGRLHAFKEALEFMQVLQDEIKE